ncbi:capsule biosynthesis protein, partial [Campylobacter sp. RM10542]|nr:capsule biosynthesis protein [Campylobacter sp. RM10542]
MEFDQKIKKEFSGKNVILLQGPVGNFFYRLAKKLKKYNAKILKINFNGGDFL